MNDKKVIVLGLTVAVMVVAMASVAVVAADVTSNPCNWREEYRNGQYSCAPWVSGKYFSSRTEAVNYLQNLGYHQTAWYASYNNNDFTLPLWTCLGYGQYRYQSVITSEGSGYRVRFNGPEPNPELHSYSWPWPYWEWYSFVREYHRRC